VRNLFFLLLVLNLVFFGWSRLIDRPRDASVASARSSAVPALELTAVPAKAAAPAEPSTHCRSVGPFADAAAAAATVDALRTRGLQPRSRSVDTTAPDGYWVYVEDLKDAAARRKVLATLNAAGMKDAAAMADESERVSVGVFTDQRHAVKRAEQVAELGIKPVLSVHQRTISNAWIDVDMKPNDADPAPVATASTGAAASKAPASDSPRVIDCPVKAPAS
jgi:hypothetical protein